MLIHVANNYGNCKNVPQFKIFWGILSHCYSDKGLMSAVVNQIISWNCVYSLHLVVINKFSKLSQTVYVILAYIQNTLNNPLACTFLTFTVPDI